MSSGQLLPGFSPNTGARRDFRRPAVFRGFPLCRGANNEEAEKSQGDHPRFPTGEHARAGDLPGGDQEEDQQDYPEGEREVVLLPVRQGDEHQAEYGETHRDSHQGHGVRLSDLSEEAEIDPERQESRSQM